MFKHATLNRSYRLIWSELHATWVAVAEFAGRRGKRSCGALFTGAVLALIAAAAAAAGDPAPNALPSGGQVVAGQVGIGASGARMDVTQSSGSAIVNWDSFNIGSHAHVNFVQPGSSSVMLNRVLGGEGSAIFGRMTANGNVFISNPGGILFAPGARVDVGGLVASSLGISDANFLAGKYHFERVGAGGTVANQGTINAANGGFVALIAPRVANGGSMTASGGSVGMAAGDSVNLDFDHDGLLSFQVNVATAAARADNSGVIVADGGRVVMDVRAKEALLSTVLNSDGIIRARSLESRNGEIWLGGGGSGVVSVTGTLDASGTGAGMHGGMVKVLGDKVGLFGQATIDVSGVGAGGTALVGGNWQGKGAERNASATYVGREVKIAANAIGRGDGGKVVAWADGDTRFYGSVSARGGALGGEGGKVEVSGKHRLAFAGKVDTRAPAGRTGMLLLDPDDIDINTGGADIATVGDGNAIVTFAESVDPGVSITPASLILLDTDVSLSANNDITFSSALSLNATRSLTAVAGRNITVNAAIDAPGGVDLTAGNSVAGTLTVAAGISSLGTIALKAGANPVLFDLTTAPVLTATITGGAGSDTVTGAGQTYTLDNATANAGSNGTVSWTSIENLTDSGAGIFQMGTAGSVGGTLTAVNGTVSYATRTAAASFALGGGASTGMGGWSGITTVAGSGNSDTVTGAGQTYTLDNATANAGSNGTVSWTSIENLTDSGAGIFQMGTAGSVGGTLTAVNGTVSYATRTAAASFALGGGASTGMGGWSGITTVAGSGNSDTVTGAGQTYTLDNATANAGSNGTVSWTSIENLTDSGAGIFQMGTAGSVGGTLTAVNGTVSYATRTAAASFALGGGASTGMGGWSGITTVAGSGNSDTVTGAGQTYTLDNATANAGSNGTVSWTSIENLTDSGAGIFQMGTAGSVAGTLTAVNGTVSYATRTAAASFALGGGASTGMGGWSGITTVAGSGNSDTVTGAGQTYTLDNATANAGSNGTVSWTSIENLTDSGAGIFQMGTAGSVGGTLTAVNGTVSYATRTAAASFALGGGASTGMGGWSGITTVAGSGNSDTVTGAGQTYTLDNATANAGSNGTVSWTSIENLTDSGAGIFQMGTAGSVGGTLTAVNGTVSYATRTAAASFALGGGASTGMGGWSGITTVAGSGNSDTVTGAGQTYTLDNATANAGSNGTVSWTSIENLTDSGAGIFQMGTAGSVGGTLTAVNGTVSYATRTAAASFALGGGASTGMGGWSGITTVAGSGNSDTVTGAGQTYTLDNATANAGSNGTVSWTSIENLTDSGAGIFQMGTAGSVGGTLTAVNGTVSYATRTAAASFALGGGASTGMGGWSGITTVAGSGNSDTVTGAGQTYTLDNATANAGSNGTVSWTSIENLTDSGAGIFQMGTAGSVGGTLTAVNGTVSYATRTAAASFALGGGASTGMGGWSGITTVAGSGNSDTVTGAGQTYTLDNATANAGSNGTVSWTSIENLTDSGAGIFQMGTAGSVGGTLTAVNGTVSYATRTAAASFALGGGASTGMGGWSGITTVAGSGNSDTVTGAGQTYTLDNATANAGSNGTVSWTSIENLTDSGAGIFQMGTAGSVGGTLTAVNDATPRARRRPASPWAAAPGRIPRSGNSDTVTGAGQTTLDNATANAGSNGTVSWTSIENLTDGGAGIFQMGTAGSVAGTLTAVNGTVSYATRTAAASFALGGGASTGMGGWSGITTVAGSGNSDTVTGAGQTYTLDNATANAGSNGTVSWTSIENLTDSGAGIFQMGTAGSVGGTLTAVRPGRRRQHRDGRLERHHHGRRQRQQRHRHGRRADLHPGQRHGQCRQQRHGELDLDREPDRQRRRDLPDGHRRQRRRHADGGQWHGQLRHAHGGGQLRPGRRRQHRDGRLERHHHGGRQRQQRHRHGRRADLHPGQRHGQCRQQRHGELDLDREPDRQRRRDLPDGHRRQRRRHADGGQWHGQLRHAHGGGQLRPGRRRQHRDGRLERHHHGGRQRQQRHRHGRRADLHPGQRHGQCRQQRHGELDLDREPDRQRRRDLPDGHRRQRRRHADGGQWHGQLRHAHGGGQLRPGRRRQHRDGRLERHHHGRRQRQQRHRHGRRADLHPGQRHGQCRQQRHGELDLDREPDRQRRRDLPDGHRRQRRRHADGGQWHGQLRHAHGGGQLRPGRRRQHRDGRLERHHHGRRQRQQRHRHGRRADLHPGQRHGQCRQQRHGELDLDREPDRQRRRDLPDGHRRQRRRHADGGQWHGQLRHAHGGGQLRPGRRRQHRDGRLERHHHGGRQRQQRHRHGRRADLHPGQRHGQCRQQRHGELDLDREPDRQRRRDLPDGHRRQRRRHADGGQWHGQLRHAHGGGQLRPGRRRQHRDGRLERHHHGRRQRQQRHRHGRRRHLQSYGCQFRK